MISVTISAKNRHSHRFSFDLSDEESFAQLALKSHIYLTKASEGSITLTATGYSLEKIRDIFSGMPMAKLQVVTWTGDHASFILENLRTYAFELTEWKQES